LAGLLENQTAAGEHSIVKVGGEVDPAHGIESGRANKIALILLR
jgi:hypothetical protein